MIFQNDSYWVPVQISSVQSLSHGLTLGLPHTRLPCPSPTPRACSNSCPSSRWCHPTISSSVVPFSTCLQSFPGSGSFPMSQFFASGGQSIGVSASASVLPMHIQDWFPLGLTSWISLQPKGLSKESTEMTYNAKCHMIHITIAAYLNKLSLFWWASQVVLAVNNPSANAGSPALETWFWFLDSEDPLEEGMATHSCILAWRIPWTEEPSGLQSIGLQRVGHDRRNLAHMHVVFLGTLFSTYWLIYTTV